MAELFKDVIIESGILNVTKKVDIPDILSEHILERYEGINHMTHHKANI